MWSDFLRPGELLEADSDLRGKAAERLACGKQTATRDTNRRYTKRPA
jgi:hypothetical protein